MNRYVRFCVIALASGLIASGCVSTGKFKKMEADKNQEITTLQQEKAVLEKQSA